MTIEEMKQHEWVVSWSGGKDSTATIILMHEHQIPIKEIVYVRMMYDDTLPATLPVMTDFVDRAKEVFEGWGYKVTFTYPERSLMDYASMKYQRTKYEYKIGHPYGVTCLSRGRCKLTMQKQKMIKKMMESKDFQMIGYACDEINRLVHLENNEKKQSIMLTLGVKEADTFDICRKYDLLSPLYEFGITRDGCWFCPNAGKKERKEIRENYPELYQKILDLINMPDFNIERFQSLNNWVRDYIKERR